MDEATDRFIRRLFLGGETAVLIGTLGALAGTRRPRRALQFLFWGTLANTGLALAARATSRRRGAEP